MLLHDFIVYMDTSSVCTLQSGGAKVLFYDLFRGSEAAELQLKKQNFVSDLNIHQFLPIIFYPLTGRKDCFVRLQKSTHADRFFVSNFEIIISCFDIIISRFETIVSQFEIKKASLLPTFIFRFG